MITPTPRREPWHQNVVCAFVILDAQRPVECTEMSEPSVAMRLLVAGTGAQLLVRAIRRRDPHHGTPVGCVLATPSHPRRSACPPNPFGVDDGDVPASACAKVEMGRSSTLRTKVPGQGAGKEGAKTVRPEDKN